MVVCQRWSLAKRRDVDVMSLLPKGTWGNGSSLTMTDRTDSSVVAVAVSPIQWSRMKHIDDVEPLNDGDAACLREIRDVLDKHDKLDRLGIALLHNHFPLADDEVMLEETDEAGRLQTLVPVKSSEIGPTDMGTIWKLQAGPDMIAMAWCRQYCARPVVVRPYHKKDHTRVKS